MYFNSCRPVRDAKLVVQCPINGDLVAVIDPGNDGLRCQIVGSIRCASCGCQHDWRKLHARLTAAEVL